jgi:glycosyltransferase 2 family protein
MTTKKTGTRVGRKQILILLLVALAVYILLPQVGVFRSSFVVLEHAKIHDLLIAVTLTALTYFAAAGSYYILAPVRLHYLRTVVIELASTFTNRLLPIGLGGIGVNYAYLRKSHHSRVQAGSVVAANNILGFIGHMTLLFLTVIIWHSHLPKLRLSQSSDRKLDWIVALIVVLVIIALITVGRIRHKILNGLLNILKQLAAYRFRLDKIGGALLTSMSLTLLNIGSLYACSQALNVHLSFVAILLVFTLGITLGTATPTPGGLGGMEAGLVVGLIAYHVSDANALAVVLAYRLISYWLALIVGIGAFYIAQRYNYLSVRLKNT